MSTLPNNSSVDPSVVPVAAGPTRKRWTREEYYRLERDGWFRQQRVELIDGEIIVMSPQSPQHYLALDRIRRCLERVFAVDYWVRPQGPIIGGDHNEPEPDVCVVPGTPESYEDHPTKTCLVVEVSKTSLPYDKTTKQSLYASMDVPDYWVLDLESRSLLVFRQPVADPKAPFGFAYEQVTTLSADQQVSPLEKPDAEISIADMLPPAQG